MGIVYERYPNWKEGRKENYFEILSFGDGLAVLTNSKEETKLALDKLHEISNKTGLQISYENLSRCTSTVKLPLQTQYRKILKATSST